MFQAVSSPMVSTPDVVAARSEAVMGVEPGHWFTSSWDISFSFLGSVTLMSATLTRPVLSWGRAFWHIGRFT